MFEKPPVLNKKEKKNLNESKESDFNLERSRKYLRKLILMGVATAALIGGIANFDSASADEIEQQIEQLEEVKQRSLDEIRENGFLWEGKLINSEIISGGDPEHVRALQIYHTGSEIFLAKNFGPGIQSKYKEKPSIKELFKRRGLSSLYDCVTEHMDIYEVGAVSLYDGEFEVRSYNDNDLPIVF